MTNQQIEMALNAGAVQAANRRQRRMNRANWWFARMRQSVEREPEWTPEPRTRHQQIWFPE